MSDDTDYRTDSELDPDEFERTKRNRGFIESIAIETLSLIPPADIADLLNPPPGPTGSASANGAISELRSSGVFNSSEVELMVEAVVHYAFFVTTP